jgi:hypothetical protein
MDDVDALKRKFPVIYGNDHGKGITLAEIIKRVGAALDTQDQGVSRETAHDLACDVIDRYFLFGAWGHLWEEHDVLMLANLRGMIAGAYEAGKAKASELKLQNATLKTLLLSRRAMEPKHSREDHSCPECEVLAEMREPFNVVDGKVNR